MTRHHRDEQSQREAERAHHEGDELDRRDEGDHRQRGAVRHEQTEELEPVLPETDPKYDRERDDREDTGNGEVAGEGKGVHAKNPQRHQPEQIGEQDEHEQAEHVRHVFAPALADIGFQHVVDEAGHAFDHHLPASGHQFALHAQQHEREQHHRGDQHPQRAVGEGDIVARDLPFRPAAQRLDRELAHRIDLGFFCHLKKIPNPVVPSSVRSRHGYARPNSCSRNE